MEKLEWDFRKVTAGIELKDLKMASLLRHIGRTDLHVGGDYFRSLCRSIIGQQVSVKAAASIFQKLESNFNGTIAPGKIASCSVEDLRPLGLSRQKASYLIDLATHFVRDPKHFEHLDQYPDEEVIKNLVHVKGIGVWTAQMFLMFVLGRPDVFAPDDLGLRNAMMKLYGWKKIPDRKKLVRTAEKWKPYRTIASRYLWLSLKNEPA